MAWLWLGGHPPHTAAPRGLVLGLPSDPVGATTAGGRKGWEGQVPREQEWQELKRKIPDTAPVPAVTLVSGLALGETQFPGLGAQ